MLLGAGEVNVGINDSNIPIPDVTVRNAYPIFRIKAFLKSAKNRIRRGDLFKTNEETVQIVRKAGGFTAPKIDEEVMEIIRKSGCTVAEFEESCRRVSKYWELIRIQQSVSNVDLSKVGEA